MCHRGSDNDVRVQIPPAEPVAHLSHEGRHVRRGRRLVDQMPIATGDPYRTGSPETGIRIALEVTRVEVKIEQDTIEPAERRVAGQDSDMVHRPSIARDRHAI